MATCTMAAFGLVSTYATCVPVLLAVEILSDFELSRKSFASFYFIVNQ